MERYFECFLNCMVLRAQETLPAEGEAGHSRNRVDVQEGLVQVCSGKKDLLVSPKKVIRCDINVEKD